MSDIKIFLASSNELGHERYKFSEIILKLNNEFRSKNLYFDLVKWEYLNSSMGPDRKQDEYNRELKTCDIVFVVFWQKFGDYTNEEFQVALNGLRDADLPHKLVVMFKTDGNPISESLASFKKSLKEEKDFIVLDFSSDEDFCSQVKSEILSYADKLITG